MKLLAALLVMATPVLAAPPPGCANLCGRWTLDTAQSSAVESTVDAALSTYTAPRGRYARNGVPRDTVEQIDAEMERSIGPIHDRPQRGDLRSELIARLAAPAQLNIQARGGDIVIQEDDLLARQLSPGTPRARVDVNGTAKITAKWKSDRLTVTERYDRKRKNSQTYALQRADDTLLVTNEIHRPGMKPLRTRSFYKRE